MSADTLVSSLPVVLTTLFSGAGAQILLKLWTRRADLRNINSTSDLNLASANEKLITQLMADGENYRKRVSELETRVEKVTQDAADKITAIHAENVRLTGTVARLQTDLDIAQGQIQQLRSQLHPYGPQGGI
jgi:chromosome segregation ATPase